MAGLLALNCAGCGAPLDIPENVLAVTCTHCNTAQSVVRGDGVAYLALVSQVAGVRAATDRTAAELTLARLQKEIWALERDMQSALDSMVRENALEIWQIEREETADKDLGYEIRSTIGDISRFHWRTHDELDLPGTLGCLAPTVAGALALPVLFITNSQVLSFIGAVAGFVLIIRRYVKGTAQREKEWTDRLERWNTSYPARSQGRGEKIAQLQQQDEARFEAARQRFKPAIRQKSDEISRLRRLLG